MESEKKPKTSLTSNGFSLIDLLTVMALITVFSYSLLFSFGSLENTAARTKQMIISAIQDARVLSITHDISEGDVMLVIDKSGIDLFLFAKSHRVIGKNYPLDLPDTASLGGKGISLSFNRFGETQETMQVFTVGNQQHILMIEQTGYAHWLDNGK